MVACKYDVLCCLLGVWLTLGQMRYMHVSDQLVSGPCDFFTCTGFYDAHAMARR